MKVTAVDRGPGRAIADAYRAACVAELDALKPGNVHRYADGHGMDRHDFVISAEVSAGPLTAPGLGLGERILRAVSATGRAVGCNTNLGILLLCGPLAHAALERRAPGSLREALGEVIRRADRQDADHVFRAIRLAAPGGLGASPHHDVRRPADAPLLEVMTCAADRDRIARQYATGFADLFDHAVPLLRELIRRWRNESWAATAVFMDLLGRFPDTHIARKHGQAKAADVQRRAASLAALLHCHERPERFRGPLLELDRSFKREGVNPGTSADLTVASLLIRRMESGSSPFNRTEGVPWVRGHGAGAPAADFNLQHQKTKEKRQCQSSTRPWSVNRS